MLRRLTYLLLFLCGPVLAQTPGEDVTGVTVNNLPNSRVRVSWDAVAGVPCLYSITYSVYRSEKDSFDPDESNRVADGVKTPSVVLLDRTKESYYLVQAFQHPLTCPIKLDPGYHGIITVHPIEHDSGGLLTSLRTKWRLETKDKGRLSYIVRSFYMGGEYAAAAYYSKARKCSFSLALMDKQGFKIMSTDIFFTATVAEESKVTGFEANDTVVLTAEQYRDFSMGGDWNLEWTCRAY